MRLRVPGPDVLVGRLAGCLVVLLAACSGGDDQPAAVVTRTITAGPSASPAEPEATATKAPTRPSPTPSEPVALELGGEGARYFETPSGNIACFLLAYGTEPTVECTVREREYDAPPQPDDCELDWVPQFVLGREPVFGVCRGDVNDPLPPVVLEYGTAAVNREIRCLSEESGLTCRNERTGHGFTLSRAEYALF